jgi:hypothetical protein
MRSHAGLSGSPVFLLIPQNSFRGEFGYTAMDDLTTRFRLIGIDTGHLIDRLPVERWDGSGWSPHDDLTVPHLSDIAVVAPISKVVDLLDRDDLAAERVRLARDLEAGHG